MTRTESGKGSVNSFVLFLPCLQVRLNCDLAATTGIHDGVSVLKQIMVGAKVVQVCELVYSKTSRRTAMSASTVLPSPIR